MAAGDQANKGEQADNIKVEIVYALTEHQYLMTLQVAAGSTVEQVIRLSDIMNQFPEIDLKKNRLGIFNKFVDLKTVLQAYDRIEIYRPLRIDPKEARRLRVKRKH
ncbi:RnfH family protein [Nitrosomonas sp.]|uniref:RnfH family protein n=1 Tax=Nitrosomonas sp. TaxID=42353 RepID=UPI001D359D95|nr:RnfH family protein [Nitrosomonas sp.]MCB1948416.1 RnfH family protein [Nitrosomonas sp.]MCP5244218.1 RnfH family protein [Burkholderiales bacterium]MDR4515680.1 RnfH family protein [Nitrosomonas sp.]